MSRSKQIGTAWESRIVAFMQEQGWLACERRALTGSLDKGDIAGVAAVMIEAKATKAITLAAFANEVAVQKRNANAAVGVAWIKRRGKASAGDGFVVMDGHQFAELLKAAGYQ